MSAPRFASLLVLAPVETLDGAFEPFSKGVSVLSFFFSGGELSLSLSLALSIHGSRSLFSRAAHNRSLLSRRAIAKDALDQVVNHLHILIDAKPSSGVSLDFMMYFR